MKSEIALRPSYDTKKKNILVRWAKGLSDAELEEEYYNAVYDSLGSQTEAMYEMGYDLRDIREQEVFEKFLCEKSNILENEYLKRNMNKNSQQKKKRRAKK